MDNVQNSDYNNNYEHSTKNPRKRKKINRYGNTNPNYNELFPNNEDVNGITNPSSTKEQSDDRYEALETGIVSIISKMSETIKFLTEKVEALSEEIRLMQSTSVLKVDDTVNLKETPLHEKFKSFDLPVTDRSRLENLENDLKLNQSFKIFFVSFTIHYIKIS